MKKITIITAIFLLLGFILCSTPQDATAQRSQNIILAGYKHKPPVRTTGSGMATVTLHGDTLRVEGQFEELMGQFSGAYIMVSLRRGEGGNQIYELNVNVNEKRTGGTFKAPKNTFILSEAEKKLLNKGKLYLIIASFEHQNGELRGDIAL